MVAGGGATSVASVPTPDARDPPPDAAGGGGTGFMCTSPAEVLPQLLRSRLTCDGGGATTAGTGRDSFGFDTSRCGAETRGATTSTVCVRGTRELARARCVSRGAGATTAGAEGSAGCLFFSAAGGGGGEIVGCL